MTDTDDRTLTVRPIGRVVGGRDEAIDDRWDGVASTIELDPDQLEPGATDGLADFSHIEVVFCFDRVDEDAVSGSWPSGRRTAPTGSA
jgi:tRNA (Thr-GGU) A37 N-methylase